MIAVWTSLAGIAATLLGAFVTLYIQCNIVDRTACREMAERARQERLDVYSRFAGVAIRYRLSELDRWRHEHESPGSDAARKAIDEAHRQRSALFEVLSRLQILSDDPALRAVATGTAELIDAIHRAVDAEERRQRGIRAGKQIELFVTKATTDIRPEHDGGVVLPFRQ
ncbi:hypothetical protein [Nocardia barduliensis]|uniref:hypothetical protein n=1 Tax=Nocardia barduliensis TaxID=2736643 RepID=UPI001571D1EE|nr:hypothetical protein [Nocardia barduliensis]